MSTNSTDHDSAIAEPLVRRGRGRPRDLKKREAILAAARALFFERGIVATMDSVAERAAVSKMTVYAHFADKPALLAAVFERTTKSFQLPELANGEDLKSSIAHLNDFGERLVFFLTRPEIIKVGNMMTESAGQYPELAAAFYAAGPAIMHARVAGFLRSLGDHGLLAIEDPELAAEQLIAAWLGLTQLRQSLGIADPPAKEAISHRVRLATQAMLRAWTL
jgi:TetR/AcrR family transcriptional repressor of mexJK operon